MTPRMLLVRPAPGVAVRRPEAPYDLLPDAPTAVVEHSYWWRRLARGDVLLCEPEVPAENKPDEAEEA